MAGDLTQRGGVNTTQIATATPNAFEPLSTTQLSYFKEKILALKIERDTSILALCKLIFFYADIDAVDHANISVADIAGLYHKYSRHFDRESSDTMGLYLSFCADVAKALQRIEEKNYGQCIETGCNIPLDQLEENYFLTSCVVTK